MGLWLATCLGKDQQFVHCFWDNMEWNIKLECKGTTMWLSRDIRTLMLKSVKFRDSIITQEINKNWHTTKISVYMVYDKFLLEYCIQTRSEIYIIDLWYWHVSIKYLLPWLCTLNDFIFSHICMYTRFPLLHAYKVVLHFNV